MNLNVPPDVNVKFDFLAKYAAFFSHLIAAS